jgi:hypothetical protein
MWKSQLSDVYLVGRTLGGSLKVSIHERGRCHVRAPNPKHWHSPSIEPPKFVDVWMINPQSNYEFPFGIIVPASELRLGPWAKHKDKGTTWIPTKAGASVEIAVFLTRAEPRPTAALTSAGWTTTIVVERLPDGRDLWVVAGETTLPEERRAELKRIKEIIRPNLVTLPAPPKNPRILLSAVDEKGTRRFVEAAALE